MAPHRARIPPHHPAEPVEVVDTSPEAIPAVTVCGGVAVNFTSYCRKTSMMENFPQNAGPAPAPGPSCPVHRGTPGPGSAPRLFQRGPRPGLIPEIGQGEDHPAEFPADSAQEIGEHLPLLAHRPVARRRRIQHRHFVAEAADETSRHPEHDKGKQTTVSEEQRETDFC